MVRQRGNNSYQPTNCLETPSGSWRCIPGFQPYRRVDQMSFAIRTGAGAPRGGFQCYYTPRIWNTPGYSAPLTWKFPFFADTPRHWWLSWFCYLSAPQRSHLWSLERPTNPVGNDLGMTQEWMNGLLPRIKARRNSSEKSWHFVKLLAKKISLKNLQINEVSRQGIRSRALEQSCHRKQKLKRWCHQSKIKLICSVISTALLDFSFKSCQLKFSFLFKCLTTNKGVRASYFCASLLCIIKWTMIRPMATGIALPGFNADLGRSVTLTLLLMDHFLYWLSTFSEKMKKIYRLEVRFFFLKKSPSTEFRYFELSVYLCGGFKCMALEGLSFAENDIRNYLRNWPNSTKKWLDRLPLLTHFRCWITAVNFSKSE